jgi:hypothetical protein
VCVCVCDAVEFGMEIIVADPQTPVPQQSMAIIGIVLVLTLADLAVYFEMASEAEAPKKQTTTEPPATSDTQKQ